MISKIRDKNIWVIYAAILILGIAPRPGTTADHLLQDLADLEK